MNERGEARLLWEKDHGWEGVLSSGGQRELGSQMPSAAGLRSRAPGRLREVRPGSSPPGTEEVRRRRQGGLGVGRGAAGTKAASGREGLGVVARDGQASDTGGQVSAE